MYILQWRRKMFFDGGAPFILRTENFISSTKHAMNLLVQKREGAGGGGGGVHEK